MLNSEDHPSTIQDAAKLAIVAQQINDIELLAFQLTKVIIVLSREAKKAKANSGYMTCHPIIRLYVDQMYFVTHKCLNGHSTEKHMQAIEQCRRMAEGY